MAKDKNTQETNDKTCEGFEKFFATEVIEQSKKSAKRWFIAFVVTLIVFLATNIVWAFMLNT